MLQFFMFRLRNVVTSDFVVQLLHLLRVKGLYFFSSPSRSKENTEDFKKYLMNVIKFRSFDSLFLGNKGKTKLAQSQNICTILIYTILRKIEHFAKFIKSGWSDFKF